MNLFSFVVRRKVFISMLFTAITLLGVVSYRLLPLEELPNVELPTATVSVSSSADTAPEYMEQQAVIPVEGAISTLTGIESLETTISRRRATITVSFAPGTDMTLAGLRLQEVLAGLAKSLPEGITTSVQQSNTEQLSNRYMTLQVRGGGGLARVRAVVDETVVPRLLTVDGIATAEVTGGDVQAIEITVDTAALEEHNMTMNTVRNQISQNQAQKAYLGNAVQSGQRIPVNITATYAQVQDLQDMVLNATGPIYLKDVGTVSTGTAERESISRVNGKDAISVQLVRDNQTNLIALSHSSLKEIAALNKDLADKDIELVVESNTAEEIEENINAIIELAITGGILAILILWFFLDNIALVAVMALSIPISVYAAFNLFYAFGITINTLTLLGIALAIGMLLDNSVVVLENIYRHLSNGRDLDSSTVVGVSEVWRAIVAATLTTITVFVPFLFSSDPDIKVLGQHVGVSIVSTLVVSLFAALFLVPALTHAILRRRNRKEVTFNLVSHRNRLYQIYLLLAKTALRHPIPTVGGATALFVVSILICLASSRDVPQEIAQEDIQLYVVMPSGSTLETTDALSAEIERQLQAVPEAQDVMSTIYAEEANITLRLSPDYAEKRGKTIAQIRSELTPMFNRFRGRATISVSTQQGGGSRYGGTGIGRNQLSSFNRMFGIGTTQDQVLIRGSDYALLSMVAESIRTNISQLESLSAEARLSVSQPSTEVQLALDYPTLAEFDVSLNSISSELGSMQRQVSTSTSYTQGDETFDILISSNEAEEEIIPPSMNDLRKLPIPDNSGGTHELSTLGRIAYGTGSASITRINREEQVAVTYSYTQEILDDEEALEEARVELEDLVNSLMIPAGVSVEVVRDSQEFNEFTFLIIAAFLLIFLILASSFESLWMPLVMMFTIPLAGIGAFWALIITGNSIWNANSLIGLLILLGVVVNNGIILLDYSRVLRSRGYDRLRALLTAGRSRVRPILITAITTIIALLPLAMGTSERIARIGAPFAITVIGGLSLSTLFTLVFLPTVYAGMETALIWLKSLRRGLLIGQGIALAFGLWIIHTYVEGMLWQGVYGFLLIVLIPGSVAFVLISLRRASANLIPAGDEVTLTIRKVVRTYDAPGRFIREWRKGERFNTLFGQALLTPRERFTHWRWQIPLVLFAIYFIYFYLPSAFWIIALTHCLYFFLFTLIRPVREQMELSSNPKVQRQSEVLFRTILWGFPALNVVLFYRMGLALGVVAFLTLVWSFALIVFATAGRLHDERININRLTGKFAGFRARFYRFVQAVPVIGKRKRPFDALNAVSLEIHQGMFGLIGPNGAGKTTIMRIICGIFSPSMGTLRVNGINCAERREELQGIIGYLPQEFGTYENMTSYEFLDYLGMLKGLFDREERDRIVTYALAAVHLADQRDSRIGSFSGGMKQRVGIALTLLTLPRILVVDEPTAGLDPRERIRFRNLLVELSRERIVIFSTHIIEDISSSCSDVAVLFRGNLRYQGDPSRMIRAAEGHVWQVTLSAREFEERRHSLRMVHHLPAEGSLLVRCLSAESPHPDAVNVTPTLEDAYLWLQGEGFASTKEVAKS